MSKRTRASNPFSSPYTTIAVVLVVGCGNPEADRALLKAADDGNIKAVKQYLDDGADVNAKDTTDETPLHYVTGFGFRKEIAKLLIAKGANVNALDKFDRTPLDYVVERYVLYLPGQITPFHLIVHPDIKSPTSSANTAARRVKN
ncbi:ankyrin repeat domain-containing protein [Verrucomicrobia bacterium]|nr:ankyrin repeat domain-containing protein [Verrucomicrobiota bacterium]